ncbi:hypothetical protein [Brevibacillus parabrevis]|uniref:hypothetical protein n=1 Tax=Brevibacillus parabrevis TaxID=54914 RepID=UPI001C24CBA9|nr:hypothetical protein [Brevibacillus parabrevis]MBU8714139.1 hypothetical protein [Brevibacillus parabrevis]MDR4998537.1 hypothetical protein [Brevibacillus parabrevis]
MRKTKLIFLVVSYLIVFGIGGYSYSFISLSESKQTGYLSETDRDKFIAFTKKIDEKFKPEGYEELLQGNENMLTTPDIILGPQQKEIETSIFGRQKNYIYKNKTNGTVILMSISKRLGAQQEQWQNSIYYSNARYNSPDNDLKAYYANVYPSVNAYQYSFEKYGYNVSCILISDSKYDKGANNLADFITQVDKFLQGNI